MTKAEKDRKALDDLERQRSYRDIRVSFSSAFGIGEDKTFSLQPTDLLPERALIVALAMRAATATGRPPSGY